MRGHGAANCFQWLGSFRCGLVSLYTPAPARGLLPLLRSRPLGSSQACFDRGRVLRDFLSPRTLRHVRGVSLDSAKDLPDSSPARRLPRSQWPASPAGSREVVEPAKVGKCGVYPRTLPSGSARHCRHPRFERSGTGRPLAHPTRSLVRPADDGLQACTLEAVERGAALRTDPLGVRCRQTFALCRDPACQASCLVDESGGAGPTPCRSVRRQSIHLIEERQDGVH